jgi:UDP-glucose 4-epimerase
VFNAYGPGQRLLPAYPPVIPNFLRQAVRKGTLVVHGNGSQTRDYVYVRDVVQAMVAAATAADIDRQILNVGSGLETSVRDLMQLIMEVTNGEAQVVYNPRKDPGVSRMCADLVLAREKLGYRPRVSLAEGLGLTLKHEASVKDQA